MIELAQKGACSGAKRSIFMSISFSYIYLDMSNSFITKQSNVKLDICTNISIHQLTSSSTYISQKQTKGVVEVKCFLNKAGAKRSIELALTELIPTSVGDRNCWI